MRETIDKETREILRPYFKSVKIILNGYPVKDLEEKRKEVNKYLIQVELNENKLRFWDYFYPLELGAKLARRDRLLDKQKGYFLKGLDPESVNTRIGNIADLENRILMGEKPSELYSKLGENWEALRSRGREILKNTVKKYLD
jgi:hypothetical protein